jgi:uncharacterized protein YutE (UPF0331/DUF86 family)
MVLRPESVRERLLKLEEIISALQTLTPRSKARAFSDRRDEWAAERGLQLAAEVLLDIGNHILSAHFGVSPQDYEDIVTQLAAHGVIDADLHARLRGIGGFRNILVHDYLRIDRTKVADALGRAPRDFSAFALAIRAWLDRLT